jgi:hypothetical protein
MSTPAFYLKLCIIISPFYSYKSWSMVPPSYNLVYIPIWLKEISEHNPSSPRLFPPTCAKQRLMKSSLSLLQGHQSSRKKRTKPSSQRKDRCDSCGWAPMHAAASCNALNVTKTLLAARDAWDEAVVCWRIFWQKMVEANRILPEIWWVLPAKHMETLDTPKNI